MASLTPDDFDLNTDAPTVTLAARFNKSRKLKVQPIPLDVAVTLREYFEGKPIEGAIWGGTWARDHRGAEMLRIDLANAGTPYAVEGPDGLEYADFHSLRHSYLTLGGRSGIDLRTLQELAGHSKPELTARYSHRRLHDLTEAVEKLPSLIPGPQQEQVEIPLRMTGTGSDLVAVPVAVEGAISGHRSASSCNLRIVWNDDADVSQTPKNKAAGADLHRLASSNKSEDDGTRTRNHRIDRHVVDTALNPQKHLYL